MKEPANYAAFISYRHCPLDMQVAEMLRKRIEYYRVQKEYRKNGKKTVGRVFRDRDELPLVEHLPDAIYSALDRSEFLIVVCTPETPKSKWVQLEIEYFIGKHGRKRILVVLANGTPQESVPEIILREKDADGNVIAEYEPLYAVLTDNDGKPDKSRFHDEFLRLMASMLGCAYDDLKQRQRQHRMKQLTAIVSVVAAVALAFAGMLINRNNEIAARLRQSQISESQTLSLLSGIDLAAGDRLSAIENALQALPYEGNERPYTPEAEGALANALNVYTPLTLDYYITLEQTADIDRLVLSDDGKYLVTQDIFGCLRCFDTLSAAMLWQKDVDKYDKYMVELLEIVESESIVLYSDWYTTYAFSLTDGTLLNQVSFFSHRENSGLVSRNTVALSGDEKFFVQYSTPYLDQFNPDTAIATRVHYLEIYDTKTFACTGQYLCMHEAQQWDMDVPSLSNDGSRLAFVLSNGVTMEVFILDTHSMQPVYQTTVIPAEGKEVWDYWSYLAWLPDNELLLYYEQRESVSLINTYFVKVSADGEATQYGPYNCYRSEDGNGADIVHYLTDSHIFFNTENGCVCAYDIKTLERTMHRSGGIAGSYLTKDDHLMLATVDGKIAYVTDSKNNLQTYHLYQFDLPVRHAGGVDGEREIFCLVPENVPNTVVILHAPDRSDVIEVQSPSIEEYGDEYYSVANMDYIVSPDGSRLFVMDVIDTDAQKCLFTVYDTTTFEKIDRFSFETKDDIRFAGFSADGTKLIFKGFLYDIAAQTLTDFESRDSSFSEYELLIDTPYYCEQSESTPMIAAYATRDMLYWWTDGADVQFFEIPYVTSPGPSDSPYANIPAVGYSGLYVMPLFEDYRDERPASYGIFSLKSQTWQQVMNPVSGNGFPWFAVGNVGETVAFADYDRTLRVYDFEKDTIVSEWSLPVSPDAIESMQYIASDRYLLIVSATNEYFQKKIHLVDMQNASMIGEYDLGYGLQSVYVQDGIAYIIGIEQALRIDLATGVLLATIPDTRCILSASDRFIRSYVDDRLTANPVYSTGELIAKGLERIQLRDTNKTG